MNCADQSADGDIVVHIQQVWEGRVSIPGTRGTPGPGNSARKVAREFGSVLDSSRCWTAPGEGVGVLVLRQTGATLS